MKLIAAYLLAVLGGKECPSSKDIKGILESVGVEADESRLSHLLSELEGKDIVELIAGGREKFASVPSGGGGGGGVAVSAPAAGGGGAAAAAPETAKEAPKPEDKEESEDDMGFSLFD